jgi:nucleoside-diphosphate-sugar epimerase
MKILVTGGAGYLGSVLVGRLLGEGHDVHVVDNLMYNQTSLFQYCSHPKFNFTKGDIRDTKLMETLLKQNEVYVPLASIVGQPACNHNPQAAAINLAIKRHCGGLQGQLIIYPCTNSGYGTKSGEVYCTEETPLEPISSYGKQKVEVEDWLFDNVENIISLRLATVFGPSQRMRLDLLVNDFTYRAFTDGFLILYEKDFKRNYLHINDFADCVMHCIEHQTQMVGGAYNLGLSEGLNEGNYSKYDLAKTIQQIIPCDILEGTGTDPDKRNYIICNDKMIVTGFKANRSIELGVSQLLKLYNMMPLSAFKNI